ncbi:hypothetical protein Z517_00491 [Fonsecaea pedrosoi CBS 271.37]|uniref:Unplaced genomic scaffold supercont1.1, whole genome shotgun sequence n=1 Tax=Fonsecaea pedrosoi CBS 271.37 TaxID=1442368 RepID=A0A0D2GVW7_9EURO|nr:uncharacterized protein Z517_00491 [Fonsecaea pedrosoi CBS 271.37]KIW85103.1 hypothetical protein Z517_00491 [Fonsecaea pedrosoi CBS 271.37]
MAVSSACLMKRSSARSRRRAWDDVVDKRHSEQRHRFDDPSTSGTVQQSASTSASAPSALGDDLKPFGNVLLATLAVREPFPGAWDTVMSASIHECATFLERYKEMVDLAPFALHLPPLTLDELLSSCPVLLLAAILTGSSADPDFEKQAGEVFRHVLADRVIVKGQKSMELFQGLLTYMLWYHHRFDPVTLQFYQLLQLANGMVADLGLPRRFAKDKSFMGRGDEDVNTNTIRAFLLCYYLNCGGGVLGYDRPENMRCIESLRNAAKLLVDISPRPLDKEAPAFIELMHLVSLHRGDGNPSEHYTRPSQGLDEWKTAYLRPESTATMKSSYHFVAAYSVLKSSSPKSMSAEDVRLSVQHFEALLSNILNQGLCYLLQLGIIEWAHLITTLFLLARLERHNMYDPSRADSPSLTHHHVGRFRALMADFAAQTEPALMSLQTPHLLEWLDKILTAVTRQASVAGPTQEPHLNSSESSHGHDHDHQHESAYELVNSFIDDKGQVRDLDERTSAVGRSHVAQKQQQREAEDFWTDFMSDWLNW